MDKFEILTLNEENVNRMFNECLKTDSTRMTETVQLYKYNTKHSVKFDYNKISANLKTIHYLIGQLDIVHENSRENGHENSYEMSLKVSILRYDKRPWTKDMETLIHFYYLGMATDMFSPIDDTAKSITSKFDLPTLAPTDSDFAQWLNDEGIMWKKFLEKQKAQETSDV